MEPRQSLTATIVYDNQPHDPRLTTDWGYACLVETGNQALLFDTGGNERILKANLALLGIDPRRIDAIMLSHFHSDHTGGLPGVLPGEGHRPLVMLPHSFPAEFKRRYARRARIVEVRAAAGVGTRARSTGEMGKAILEQSLILETDEGLIVMTGCAHPGIVDIVARAREHGPVALVMGGFHLKDAGAGEIKRVIEGLKRLGVRKVAPSHCTGTPALRMFAAAYGDDFIPAGAGAIITSSPQRSQR